MSEAILKESNATFQAADETHREMDGIYLRWIANKTDPFDKGFLRAVREDPDHLTGNLKVDLMTRAYWTGRWKRDWWVFQKNHHKSIGIFFSHPESPFSTKGRVVVFLSGVCLALFTVALTEILGREIYQQATCTGEFQGGDQCEGVSHEAGVEVANDFTFYLSFGCAAVVVMYMSLLRAFATCLCCQRKNEHLRCAGDCFGGMLMTIQALVSLFFAILGIVMLSNIGAAGDGFWTDFLNAQLNSMAYDVLIVTAKFVYTWRKQRGSFELLVNKAIQAQNGTRTTLDADKQAEKAARASTMVYTSRPSVAVASGNGSSKRHSKHHHKKHHHGHKKRHSRHSHSNAPSEHTVTIHHQPMLGQPQANYAVPVQQQQQQQQQQQAVQMQHMQAQAMVMSAPQAQAHRMSVQQQQHVHYQQQQAMQHQQAMQQQQYMPGQPMQY